MGISPEPPPRPGRENAPDNVRGEAINLIVVEALRDALISLEEDDKHRAIDLIRKVIKLLSEESVTKPAGPDPAPPKPLEWEDI